MESEDAPKIGISSLFVLAFCGVHCRIELTVLLLQYSEILPLSMVMARIEEGVTELPSIEVVVDLWADGHVNLIPCRFH